MTASIKFLTTAILGAAIAGCNSGSTEPATSDRNSTKASKVEISADPTQAVVDRLINGYGGAAFVNLEAVTITSDLRYGWLGQGQYPDYTDLDPMRKIYEVNLKKGWGSEEAWGNSGGYAERVFYAGEGQYTINLHTRTYEHDPEANFYSHFGGEIRATDTLLAYDLMKHRETAELVGEQMFWGAMHDLITYDMPGTGINPEIWVNRETGHISKMRRNVPDAFLINYVFANFQQADGITFADDFELYIDDKLVEYAKSRDMTVGKINDAIWSVGDGVTDQGETIESGEMVVDKISETVDLVGQFGAWTAFVDAGDHVIALGGYGGLGERLAAYRGARGDKPLKYLVLTHHHLDHVEGAADALEAGAQLIGPEVARANLEDVTDKTLSDTEFMAVTQDKVALGPVELHRIYTSHVSEFILPYVPSIGLVYDEDHYFSARKDVASPINRNGMSLISEIERIGLQPQLLATAHSRKVESWPAIKEMAAKHVPGLCPLKRKICRDLIK